jgi:sugar phosphate isomerase/epimerase
MSAAQSDLHSVMPDADDDLALMPQFWTLAGDVRPGDGHEIGAWPLSDRVNAAADAGFKGFGFWMPDLFAAEQSDELPALAAGLRDRGIRHAQFELGVIPWWHRGDARAQVDAWLDRTLRVIERLGVPDAHVKCVPAMGDERVSLDDYAEGFQTLSAASADVGARMGIEFLPFSSISSARTALELTEAAGHPNGGIVIDSWHVFRGDPDLDFIRTLRAEQIVAVELDDADAEVVGTLGEDTIDRRRYCGDGAFPLAAFLDAIRATGFNGCYVVEIISEEARSLALVDAAARAYDTSSALLYAD